MTTPRDPVYAGHRYPGEITSCALWLYFRFPLSLRMVEEMLAARGISVTHKTIRQWGLKFGREFANRIRRRAPRRGDKWHLDEVVISIAGKSIGCGVPSTKMASISMFSSGAGATRRPPNAFSASSSRSRVEPFGCWSPQAQQLRRGQARRHARGDHRQHKGLDNRAENSHHPTRRRERFMGGSSRRGTFVPLHPSHGRQRFPPPPRPPTLFPQASGPTAFRPSPPRRHRHRRRHR